MPDWYGTLRAAEKLHCTPWELESRDDGEEWGERALMAIRAEAAAQRIVSEQAAKKQEQRRRR